MKTPIFLRQRSPDRAWLERHNRIEADKRRAFWKRRSTLIHATTITTVLLLLWAIAIYWQTQP